MSSAFVEYIGLLDELRRLRDRGGARSEQDPILESMDGLWEDLSEAERVAVDQSSWRAWPDEFRRRAPAAVRQDVDVWAQPSSSPRMLAGAA